jgi:monoamine oxidase
MIDVAIVGGGLAGLSLAVRLFDAGVDVKIYEARSRLGGRVHGFEDGGHRFDLGPSWYWLAQPRMAQLTHDLGLRTFDQYATGDLVFEGDDGHVQRGVGFSSMEGSFRIRGGMSALIDGLAARLPSDRIALNARVISADKDTGLTLEDGDHIATNHVVLACPPRVAARIEMSPSIETDALDAVPTWMGGQAKFVATYDSPFWRDAGLSGGAMSRRGLLAEIHDASPDTSELGALFGFVGVPAQVRSGQADAIKTAALKQLARLFGPKASNPRMAILIDWADERDTSGALDKTPLFAHPNYGMPTALLGEWDGRLHLGSTEVARTFGGYLEGALERADELAENLIKS